MGVVTALLVDSAAAYDTAAALRYATQAPEGSDLRAWYEGVHVGGLVALDIVTTDELVIARATFFARCVPFDDVQPPTEDPERRRDVYRASGVLLGFKEATEERMDAVECSACDCRILLDEPSERMECTTHGHFCDEACARETCDRRCWA